MYCKASGVEFEECREEAVRLSQEEACLVKEVQDGLIVDLLDLESAGFLLAEELIENKPYSGYCSCYREEFDISFSYAIRSIFKAHPIISVTGGINVNHGYGMICPEDYATVNGKLQIRRYLETAMKIILSDSDKERALVDEDNGWIVEELIYDKTKDGTWLIDEMDAEFIEEVFDELVISNYEIIDAEDESIPEVKGWG